MTNWLCDDYGVRPRVMTGGAVLTCAVIIGLAFYLSKIDEENWQQFVKDHNCVVVGKMSGSIGVGTGIGSNGQVVTVTTIESNKTGWKCGDGITYWR